MSSLPNSSSSDNSTDSEKDVILDSQENSLEEKIPVASELHVSAKKAGKLLEKRPGELFKPGDTLAIKTKLFGIKGEKLTSSIYGVVLRYERDSGELVVRERDVEGSETQINNNANQEEGQEPEIITESHKEEEVEKNTKPENEDEIKHDDNDILGIGEAATGILHLPFKNHGDDTAEMLFALDSRLSGSIILGTHFTRELLIKTITVGVKGIVGSSISEEDLKYLVEKNLVIPVLVLPQAQIKKIEKWEGKKVTIDGNTGEVTNEKDS